MKMIAHPRGLKFGNLALEAILSQRLRACVQEKVERDVCYDVADVCACENNRAELKYNY